MNTDLAVEDAIALVPGWHPDSSNVEALQGGLTNRSFLVHQGSDRYVLRLNAHPSDFAALDRNCELTVLRSAAEAGLGPEIMHADIDNGILVTKFLEGRVWSNVEISSVANLESLGKLLRRVHQMPVSGTSFDKNLSATRYQEFLEDRQGAHTFARQCVDIIERIPTNDRYVCCHNDVVAQNVIASSSLRLIDWEYACDNEPLFDLASVICYHNLDSQMSDILLAAYTGGVTAELKERLTDQSRIFDAMQWLWLACHHLNWPQQENVARLAELQQRIH